MHPYLAHLLSDISKAHRDISEKQKETEEQLFEKHIEQVERYIHGDDSSQTLGYFCGLEKIDFPPAEQFSEKEIKQVYEAFQNMLHTWNAQLDLPENLPWRLRYKLMVDLLSKDFVIMEYGVQHFDYCTGHAPDCAMGKYCPCLEIWHDMKKP